MKNTKGPWIAKQLASYNTPGFVILWPDCTNPGVHHRRLDFNGGFIEADARLIAAAPDLLALARTVIEHVCGGRGSASELADAARAVIAKATDA